MRALATPTPYTVPTMDGRFARLALFSLLASCGGAAGTATTTATACYGDGCHFSAQLTEVELYDGLRRGILKASARGVSISESELLITSKLDLLVRVDSGTQFGTPPNAEYQGMVVTQTARVHLRAGVRTLVSLPTACTHHSRRIPNQDDTFEVVAPPPLLAKLMRCLEHSKLRRPEKQIAVWLLTDRIDEPKLGARPQMIVPLLVERCVEKNPSRKEHCHSLVTAGLALAHAGLLKRARSALEACGIGPENFGLNRDE